MVIKYIHSINKCSELHPSKQNPNYKVEIKKLILIQYILHELISCFAQQLHFEKPQLHSFEEKMINIHNHYHKLLLNQYLDKIIMEQTNLNETQHHAKEVSPIEQLPEYPPYSMSPPMLARGKILNQ